MKSVSWDATTHERTIAARRRLVAAAILVGSLLLAPPVVAQQRPSRAPPADSRAVSIQLNGRWLADGVAIQTGAGEEVLLPVAALARAVDGDAGLSESSSRLRLDAKGSSLFAARVGGCGGCPARVVRTVIVSSRIRSVAGALALPLADLVAAFEGRLEADSARTLFGIHAGKCTWCILEPSSQ